MNAFDMISEPIFFVEQLSEHSNKVHQAVGLIPVLADALLAQDSEKMTTLQERTRDMRQEVDHITFSLHEQIRNMHFHSAGGPAFDRYLACQDKVISSAQEFADLLVLRKTTVPAELQADFQALVAQVVNVSQRTKSLAEDLSSEVQTFGADVKTQSMVDAAQRVRDDNGQAERLEMQFARHLYSLEKQLDPVTLVFLDKCCNALRDLADNAAQTAEQLRLMIR